MTRPSSPASNVTRRMMLQQSLAALGLLLVPGAGFAAAQPDAARAAIAALVGDRAITDGGIKLTTPAIAENGNTVPLSVAVESAFTPDDYVEAIHLFAAGNPSPDVISFYFTPASGKAEVASRIRLAKTQQVIAIAEMSDGRVLRAANEVKVTIGGCGG